MTVLSFHNQANSMLSVDLFVQQPIPFADLQARAERMVIDNAPIQVCSIYDLIAPKRHAGRPQDLQDIENLRRIQEERKPDGR